MLLGSPLTACAPHMCTCTSTLAFLSCLLRGIRLSPRMDLWLYRTQIRSLDGSTSAGVGAVPARVMWWGACLEVEA